MLRAADFPRLAALSVAILISTTLAQAGNIPRPAPSLVVTSPEGVLRSLQSLRGKVVLVEFFLTTCPHCQKTATILEPIYKKWRARGLEVLAIAINPDARQLIADFRKRFGCTYPICVGDPSLLRTFGEISPTQLPFVPYVFMIDRKGVIRGEHPGGEESFWGNQDANLRAELDALLKEPVAARKSAGNTNAKSE